jgi:hypothetical protein
MRSWLPRPRSQLRRALPATKERNGDFGRRPAKASVVRDVLTGVVEPPRCGWLPMRNCGSSKPSTALPLRGGPGIYRSRGGKGS